MKSRAVWVLLLLLPFFLVPLLPAQGSKFSIKTLDQPPPTELAPGVQKLFVPKAVQLLDGTGKAICDVWFRPEIPVDATPEQIKNGLTYKEVKQSEILGAIRFHDDWRDYRKQKVKAGVYTLRLAFQPQDGDHTGSSEFQDFVVLISANLDPKADLVDAKHLSDVSAKSIASGHPAVLMLFPNNKLADQPDLEMMPKHHWVLNAKGATTVAGKKTSAALGIGLTLVGAAD